ncbi:hypothetical protein ACIRST_37690 [Kitasatospora sp. NPDC101447]|uniref:hypothetical protein n=1 Tax=Kitasatospora sp. NPDC101447 TaxID=3364102 RepID=UPI0038071AAA
MDDTTAAKARAYWACVEIGCPKCRVEPGQFCRNKVDGVAYNALFHKPRQVDAGAPGILATVGIRKLRWQPAVGMTKWDGRPMPVPMPGLNASRPAS